MLISAVCFASDVYFFINHKKNLEDLKNNNGGIIFMHFLIVRLTNRVCDYICVYILCTCIVSTYLRIYINVGVYFDSVQHCS